MSVFLHVYLILLRAPSGSAHRDPARVAAKPGATA
jgi:hypothetical protein